VIVVTDAYLADAASQELDGRLHVEGDHLDRVQIDPDGIARTMLVVHHRRPKVGGSSSIEVDLVYPGGGREKIWGINVPPQEFKGQDGFVFVKLGIDAPLDGEYKLIARGSWGDEIAVPVALFGQR
jgi:hypothetical protein